MVRQGVVGTEVFGSNPGITIILSNFLILPRATQILQLLYYPDNYTPPFNN